MLEERVADIGSEADRRFRREILRHKCTAKTQYAEQTEQQAAFDNINFVAVLYADVDYRRDYQRNNQLERHFNELEKRRENTFNFVFFQILQKL